jgi:hypothetical protein
MLSIGERSFDSGCDKACPAFEFVTMKQHAIMDGKFENLFVGG